MKAFVSLGGGRAGWAEKEVPQATGFDGVIRPLLVSPCTSDVHNVAIDCLALTPGSISMGAAFSSVCAAAMLSPENVAVLAGSAPMVELMRLAGQSAAAFDAPAEVRLAAGQVTFCRAAEGAAAEYLYQLVRNSEGQR